MDEPWKTRILQLKYPQTHVEALEFVSLVYQMDGNCTPEVVDVLMKTFSGEEDYEVQESVVSVLASANPEVYVAALLKELPRLLAEAPEWAEALIGQEVELHPERFISIASKVDDSLRQTLMTYIMDPAFVEVIQNARMVSDALEKSN